MKRVLLTIALCVAASSTVSFAQKKALKEAQSIAKSSNADYNEARTLIKGALENAETKDLAETWFVAGFIEDQQYNAENTKQMLGQQPNEQVMYDALYSILPYFEKAYELDLLPNEKGKVKSKYAKDIKSILTANHLGLFNGGAYYFEKQDYKKAYDFFNQYIAVSDLPMFEGTKTAEKDSTFMTVQFYAAVAATQIGDSQIAISALERAKDTPYRQYDVYQYLCYEYEQAKDTVNLEKTLMEGNKVFPDSAYYLNSLINLYVATNRNNEALDALNTAISKASGDTELENLYSVLGYVYERGMEDYENAEINYAKALEKNPESTEANSNLGRIYYNRAVKVQGEANMINDNQKYQEELSKAKDLFKQALPYYEKAHKANPGEMQYMIALRGIYYNLNMGPELEAIEKEMNQ